MSTTRHTILIVEDEKPLLNAIRTKLEHSDFEVVTARSVEQALDYINSDIAVDAIWLDHYLLGKGTGLDFIAQLKEDESHKNIPVFVVSNSGTPDKEHTYLRLGVAKYYVKADFRLDGSINDIVEYLNKTDKQ